MTVIGFHASHEQVRPAALLTAVQDAERAGFTAAMCSDHLMPWSRRQGQSAFALAWLGAALQATSLPFGMVHAPGQRYHPVITAQALATLAAMYPGRFWAALGSGENINEHVTGDAWPRKEVREQRLRECVDVIRHLFTGEELSHTGLVTVDRARLWTLPDPEHLPPLLAAAVTPRTAGRVASWADGLITVLQKPDVLREVIANYRGGGGRGPVCLQIHLSWDPDGTTAFGQAYDQWRSNTLPSTVAWDLATVAEFDAVTEHATEASVREIVQISSDLSEHADRIAGYAELGFDRIFLHHVGQDQTRWIPEFGEHVLPKLDVTRPEPAVATRTA